MKIFLILFLCFPYVHSLSPTSQPRVLKVGAGEYAYLESQCEGPVRGPFFRGGRYGVCCDKRVGLECTRCCVRKECKHFNGACLKCKRGGLKKGRCGGKK
jgi:hypothetical protein